MLYAIAIAVALILLSPIIVPLHLLDLLTGGPERRRMRRFERRIESWRREIRARHGLDHDAVELEIEGEARGARRPTP